MAKNKTLKVLTTGSVAGMIAAAVLSSQAFAAVDAYTVKIGDDVLKYDKAALTESFLASKAGEAAPLYNDFAAKLAESKGFYAFSDNKTGKYVSYSDIQAKFLEAKAAGEVFNVDTYTESAAAQVVEVPTVKKVTVVDGKVVIEQVASATAVESASVTGAKKLQVNFNKEVDLSKLTFAVKRGSAVVTLDPTLSADKKSVVLSSVLTLVAGDYTVTVTGTGVDTVKNVATVKVEAEKETTLSITSDTVSKVAAAKINFEVKNQYGELMNVAGTSVTATAYDRTDTTPATSAVGAVTLNGTAGKSELTGNFTAASVANNDEVLVTVSYKGLSTSKVLTAKAAAAVDTVQLSEVVLNTGKTRVTVGETVELKYTAVDQYGAEIKLGAYNDAVAPNNNLDDKAVIGDYQLTSSNPLVVDADSVAIDANGKMTINALAAGTTKLLLVNVKTGSVSSIDVTVYNASAADAITLTAPNTLVAVGETVKVPYTVVNQFGEEIKPINLNTAQVVVASSNNAVATVAWVGKEIVITGAGAGTAEISATIGTKVVKFSIDIQALAVPTKVVGVKDVAGLYENGAASILNFSKILVKDQYGRNYTLKNGDVVTVTPKDATQNGVMAVLTNTAGAATFDDTTDLYTFTGTADKSIEVYTIAISGVTGSEYDLTLQSVATTDISSYELKAINTVYANALNTAASNHAVAVSLVGKNVAGTEVALLANKITNITTTNASIVDVDLASKKVFAVAKGEATVAVWNGATKLAEVKVVASDVAPVLTTATFANSTVNKLVADVDFTNVLTLKDQYGVAITPGGTFTSSNTTVASVNAATGLVDVLAAGETTIGYVAPNGVVATYTLTVQ